jgi:hypothetical protein
MRPRALEPLRCSSTADKSTASSSREHNPQSGGRFVGRSLLERRSVVQQSCVDSSKARDVDGWAGILRQLRVESRDVKPASCEASRMATAATGEVQDGRTVRRPQFRDQPVYQLGCLLLASVSVEPLIVLVSNDDANHSALWRAFEGSVVTIIRPHSSRDAMKPPS